MINVSWNALLQIPLRAATLWQALIAVLPCTVIK
jgi:hypothetical protein